MKKKKTKILLASALILPSLLINSSKVEASKASDNIGIVSEKLSATNEKYSTQTQIKGLYTYYIDNGYVYQKDALGKSLLVKDSFVEDEDKVYYANSNGQAVTGLVEVEDKTYYFDNNYNLVVNKESVADDRLIQSDENGLVSFVSNKQIEIKGIKYKSDKDGYLKKLAEGDPLKPKARLALDADQLAQVINKAYPNNKLIKDNDSKLTEGFTQTLVDIEDEYGINPFFILGIISAENPIMNGKISTIVKDKNNLMSWNAFDDDPYNKSAKFETYADAIKLPAKYLDKNYLDPEDPYYVDGSVAGVNKHYATDKNWNVNVSSGMKKLNEAKKSLGF